MFELRCFGQVELFDQVGNERVLRSRKHIGLLLYLVANARTTHTREELADLLWDGTGKRERHSLSQALYDIRTSVGDVLVVSTTTVRIRPRQVVYEVTRLEEAIESRDHETALDLYRGEFAPDMTSVGAEMFDRWVDSERERCRVLATLALRNAQRAAEERGDWDRMCLAALRLIRVNTYDEEAHCALMRGLWMKGDPASALRHYRSIDPDLVATWRSVKDLAARIEDSGSVREVLTVPREPVRLVGREPEFKKLFDLISAYKDRGCLVAVAGEPGVGKSSILTELARLLTARGVTVDRALGRGNPTGGRQSGSVLLVDASGPVGATAEAHARPSNVVLFTTRDPSNAKALRRSGEIDEVVRIERLNPSTVERVVAERVPEVGSVAARMAAHLSGGNPGLAIDIARVLADRPGLAKQAPDEVGQEALRSSAALRSRVEEWMLTLPHPASEYASHVALFDPGTLSRLCDRSNNDELRTARKQLAGLGWLAGDGGAQFAIPLLRVALRDALGRRVRLALHEAAARELQGGDPADEYAASRQLVAAGDRSAARRAASNAAFRAIRDGDAALASAAGRLASSLAETVSDRMRHALLTAEANLRRGDPEQCERTIREISHLRMSQDQCVHAQLLMVGAMMAGSSDAALERETHLLERLAEEVSDRPLLRLMRLRLAEAHFCLTGMKAPARKRSTAAQALESELVDSAEVAVRHPGLWLSAFRALFVFRMTETSVDSSAALLHLLGPTLDRLRRQNFGDIAGLSRPIIEMRRGRLQSGLQMAESVVRNSVSPDRFRTAALNNWGVALTEAGDFERAREVLSEASGLDAELGPTPADRLHTILNQSQAAWFMSDTAGAVQLATEGLELARREDLAHLEAEANVLLGLAALESGGTETAYQIDDVLSQTETWEGRIQDPYLVHWFRAWVAALQGNDPTAALLEESAHVATNDRLAGAKLAVVAGHLGSGGDPEDRAEAIRTLRKAGAGWFIRRVGRSRTDRLATLS